MPPRWRRRRPAAAPAPPARLWGRAGLKVRCHSGARSGFVSHNTKKGGGVGPSSPTIWIQPGAGGGGGATTPAPKRRPHRRTGAAGLGAAARGARRRPPSAASRLPPDPRRRGVLRRPWLRGRPRRPPPPRPSPRLRCDTAPPPRSQPAGASRAGGAAGSRPLAPFLPRPLGDPHRRVGRRAVGRVRVLDGVRRRPRVAPDESIPGATRPPGGGADAGESVSGEREARPSDELDDADPGAAAARAAPRRRSACP